MPALRRRLDSNAVVLLGAYRASTVELTCGRGIEPAAEWLLDNYHVVEEQIRQIRDDLPPNFYRQLPKLSFGPLAGYPRVLGVAWAFVAHTDSTFDIETLCRFIAAYQSVQALTIGELWAVAITLRIVLVENLRRLADEISVSRAEHDSADTLADALLASGAAQTALDLDATTRSNDRLPDMFAAQLSKRLRNQDPRETPVLAWLQHRLGEQGDSTDSVVQQAQQRQGASNVSVRNVITSMRLISDIDWSDWFESVSLPDQLLREASAFASMDFATRDLYRKEIERLARDAPMTEVQITQALLDVATRARIQDPDDARVSEPGYYLIAQGRQTLEAHIGYRPPWRLRLQRLTIAGGLAGYTGAILGATVALAGLAAWLLWLPGVAAIGVVAFLLLALAPLSELVISFLNRLLTWKLGAAILPALDLTRNLPKEYRTLIAVPALLTNEAEMRLHIEQLEVLYLSGMGGDLVYALLTDGLDAQTETTEADLPILAAGAAAITELNLRHGLAPGGSRFLLLNRRRRFNPAEAMWMGWERKRGKLHELNRLLRGASDTSYAPIAGLRQQLPSDVRYVLTLDADTRLPRDTAQRLVGKMAHPLNRPRFDAVTQRVVEGYAILQPRVTPSLPLQGEGSLYQRLFSSPAGIDPYAAAVSDVYQDLFGEGSYTGKGIYDIDAFEAALADRVPENTMLSHDLFEGVFARAGLVTDIEVVDEFPARYDVASRRTHRWTRGDWQLLPWLFGPTTVERTVSTIGRGKMFDNLRRSLLAPTAWLALVVAWTLPEPTAVLATVLIVLCQAIPAMVAPFSFVAAHRSGVSLRHRTMLFGQDLSLAGQQLLASFVFLADSACKMTDAIVRTLFRVFVTHRRLLEWTTAAQSAGTTRLTVAGLYRMMWPSICLATVMAVCVLCLRHGSWFLVLPFTLLWLAAPACAWWISRPRAVAAQLHVSPSTAVALRHTARRTWRFFETFVTAADHMLPPDNFQETPKPVLARRTSPTNMGLYLLSVVAARDFGWVGTCRAVTRLEETLATMLSLPQHNGHFFNWYATDDLQVLQPAYVSSVDSGNLAGHLITLANACEQWRGNVSSADARVGLGDDLALAFDALSKMHTHGDERFEQLAGTLAELDTLLQGRQDMVSLLPIFARLATKAAGSAHALQPAQAGVYGEDLTFWTDALACAAQEHRDDLEAGASLPQTLDMRLQALADTARAIALAMDFAFLLDPERKLLSIGYSLVTNQRDANCYDLLASEARLASLFAIAKGDVSSRHWLRLGRSATPVRRASVLISWSGSMFEYLMPSLIMRAPSGSLLEQTNRMVVQRQQDYAASLGIPWGISESAYNARDLAFTYQYLNFGVPGLGLKRGLAEDLVVAPYATGLATMVDPQSAYENYERLAQLGALGRYGFHEALDFTPSRLRKDETVAVVRSFMAHHQGMTIVAIVNALLDGRMRERFHREPMIQACGPLLQERMPRDVVAAYPRVDEVKASSSLIEGVPDIMRAFEFLPAGPPHTHLLSNGSYTVMLTAGGGGYSRWRDLAITRWHGDSTHDDSGSYLFLRDRQSGNTWSATPQPGWRGSERVQIGFSEDRVNVTRIDGSLKTSTQIQVSGENDGEVRRVSLANNGRHPREIEVTSYAELVLAEPVADRAHPAFSKMFVVTEFLPEFGALIATRRPRSPQESRVWVAHFAIIEGEVMAPVQYETDRARFVDGVRTGWMANPVVQGRALSNTVGTVLDPVISLRHSVRIAPGRVARIAFWTLAADTREALLDLVDAYHDHSAFERAETLAWTQAQVQLRHLGMHAEEAASFQQLAAPLLYPDARFRAPSKIIVRGMGSQSGLWQYGISGDLPIVLLRIDDMQDMELVRQMLRAHEYWRMKRLAVDLVIINERSASYIQDLQIAIDTAVRSSHARPSFGKALAKGAVYTLRADLMGAPGRTLIQAVARIELLAAHGAVEAQIARRVATPSKADATWRSVPTTSKPLAPELPELPELEFFNGLGGFDQDGREYVIGLQGDQNTPTPWINVIANPEFGFQVSAQGSGYTWSENSKDNVLTPWSNDPVTDPTGEVFYLRDQVSGELWSPTASPIRDTSRYVARHGFGYSRFAHVHDGIDSDLLQFVPLKDPIKISRLTLVNRSDRHRVLSVTAYVEWVLGTARSLCAPFLITRIDPGTGAMFAENAWNPLYAQRRAFADLSARQTSWTADRREFLGENGEVSSPVALVRNTPLSGRCGAALDPCAALQCALELKPDESVEIVFFLGQAASDDEARALVNRYRQENLDDVLDQVKAHWQARLGAIQVKTPDRAMDIMVNGWLLYQTIACRLWARAAFYQASGAYGFRDQLQDSMALMFTAPEVARGQLLRAAGRQFVEGDVQHWWLPPSGQGVRTRISDDRVWLAYAAANYVLRSGDPTVLDEQVPFLQGPLLSDEEHDAFFLPAESEERATLFEHCARGLDQCVALTGSHGLPLMGTGDWNDGMSRVGAAGRGESVWLGWLFLCTVDMFEPIVRARDPIRAQRWRDHADRVREAIEATAWDGQWYRRATFDDGTWLGSAQSEECSIDSIAQSWAVLSGAAQTERAAMAMASFDKHLVRRDDGVALLLSPPFDQLEHDPGYIKGYPPGLRENGGQYTHAAIWAVLAYAKMGNGDKAAELFSLINPVNHARKPQDVRCYKVEPYVMAADVYSVAPHIGRGGWTWYTGSAGWMYRAGVEGIVGLQRSGTRVSVKPCIPAAWPGYDVSLTIDNTRYAIHVENVSGRGAGVSGASMDGVALSFESGQVELPLDGVSHRVTITL